MTFFPRIFMANTTLMALLSIFPALSAAPDIADDAAISVPMQAQAILQPLAHSTVQGIATFTQTPNGVKISVDAKGLTPGEHGFHIHEFGDCSSPDGMSAGGHFNPADKLHGGLKTMERHEGDFGNIIADEHGNVHYEVQLKYLEFKGNNSFMGRGLIIHAGKDDTISQPAGNSGARIACGVIGWDEYKP